MPGKLNKILAGAVLGLALAALLVQFSGSLFDYFTQAVAAIRYPYSLDYGEGPLLDQTLRLARFENIYRPSFDEPPYTISNYPPLFPLVQVPFAWAFGPAFWYGRAIAIAGVVATALFIFLTLRALTHQWIGPLIGGLLVMAFPYVQHWSMFNRVDELALALSWAALYVTVRWVGLPDGESTALRRRGFWLAVVLFTGSIYTRQTYALAAPLAAFVWLLFMRRYRRALELGAAAGGLALALFILLNLLTAGGFYLNIVVANVNTFFWRTVENYAKEIRDRLYILWGAAALFLLLERFIARGRTRTWPLAGVYLLAAAGGAITIGKDGSNVNYLLELSAALSFAVGAAFTWLGSLGWSGRRWLQAGLAAALAFQVYNMAEWTRDRFITYMIDRTSKLNSVAGAFQEVAAADGIVLADEYMGLVPLAGKRLYFQPFEYKQMYDAGLWDENPFLLDIANQKFDVILWYTPATWRAVEARWTKGQRDAITSYYQITARYGDILVYTPRR